MADQSPIAIELREITELLIKARGLHDGKWMLAFEYGMGGINIGPSPVEIRPAAFFQINKILLVAPPIGIPMESPFIVDASVVNPQEKKPGADASSQRTTQRGRRVKVSRSTPLSGKT